MLDILGVIGIAISVAAYVPQVIHLAREHCSAGVSSRAWTMWMLSGLLVGLVAVRRGDAVFILLQLSSFTSAAAILLLARRYKGMRCETHAHLVPTPRSRVTAVHQPPDLAASGIQYGTEISTEQAKGVSYVLDVWLQASA